MARPLYKNLTAQVLTAVGIGIAIGALRPDWGVALKPVGDGFVRLVKLIVGPVIFLTIVGGIAGMGDLKRVGRVGIKALVYFELITTIALGIGLVVANVLRPGAGVATQGVDASKVSQYTDKAQGFTEFVLHIIPDSMVGPFVSGDTLQVLFLSVLTGSAVALMGERGHWITQRAHHLTELLFKIIGIIMRVAPLGALGAMAYTVGAHGLKTLVPLLGLMACVYLTMVVFVFVVLGAVLRGCGVGLWSYLVYIKNEIVLVLGTSSSESALPRMIEKMRRAGCGREVSGLVIPAGYSFNLDGTSIYLSMAVLFIAQAYGVQMGIAEQLAVLGVLMLTSKGAAAVTGAGFVTLAATLSSTHVLPVEGLTLLLGVDRFMSEARSITNLIGNGVAAIAVSRMEGEFDVEKYKSAAADAAD